MRTQAKPGGKYKVKAVRGSLSEEQLEREIERLRNRVDRLMTKLDRMTMATR